MLETMMFAVWGIAWAVYFMLDGFDLGLGILFPFVAKTETDRRLIVNAMGPFWDGNEVWLITAGGVTFAAFPATYAVMFSGLYTPLMLLLFALILRGVAFEFRNKVDSAAWRACWDASLVVGSSIAALLLGVAFANIFAGLPLDRAGLFHGNLLTLLNPYGLLGGVLFVLMFAEHGALWLAARSEGALHVRIQRVALRLWFFLASAAVLFLAATWLFAPIWQNLLARPYLLVVPGIAVAALLLMQYFVVCQRWWKAWFASSTFIVAATLFGVAGMYPNLLMSTLDAGASMSISNSASSPLTLGIMLGVVACFLPIVIGYQIWVYLTFREAVTEQSLSSEEAY